MGRIKNRPNRDPQEFLGLVSTLLASSRKGLPGRSPLAESILERIGTDGACAEPRGLQIRFLALGHDPSRG